jgi:hypothetical protein
MIVFLLFENQDNLAVIDLIVLRIGGSKIKETDGFIGTVPCQPMMRW